MILIIILIIQCGFNSGDYTMWFKNLNIYRVENFEDVNVEKLEERMNISAFEDCNPHEEQKTGWISPMGENFEQFVHTANGGHMICLKSQVKKIPASFINEKIKEAEDEKRLQDPDFKRFSKDEKEELKDKIKYEYLPNAFPSNSVLFAYIDTQQKYMLVDSSSGNKSEGMILFLKSMLENDGVKFIPLQTVHEPANTMSNWLVNGEPHADLHFGEKCKIKDFSSTDTVNYTKHDMDDNQLVDYLKSDMSVCELSFTWIDNDIEKVSFVLTDDFVFKSLNYHASYKDEVENMELEGMAAVFDAEFDTMIMANREFIPFILKCFGGANES